MFLFLSLIPLCGVLIVLQSFVILTKEFKGKVEMTVEILAIIYVFSTFILL